MHICPDAGKHFESRAVMFGDLSHVEKIYIRCGYTDMRKQLNGLLDIIQYNFKLDSYSNSLFLFCGKRADRIKAVHYEGDGFCLLYKRYENGRLQWPRTGEEAKQISDQQLRWLLEGLNPEQPRRFKNGFRISLETLKIPRNTGKSDGFMV